MEIILFILAKTVSIFLSAVSMAMLLRVVLSFFTDPGESRIYALCFYISEPFIMPFRLIMSKLNIGQDSPIDIPFFVSALVLNFLLIALPVI